MCICPFLSLCLKLFWYRYLHWPCPPQDVLHSPTPVHVSLHFPFTSPPCSHPRMSLLVLTSFFETQSQGLIVDNHQHPLSPVTSCTTALPSKRHFIFPHAQSQPTKLSISQSVSSTKRSFILSESVFQVGAGYYGTALSLHVTRPKQLSAPTSHNKSCVSAP